MKHIFLATVVCTFLIVIFCQGCSEDRIDGYMMDQKIALKVKKDFLSIVNGKRTLGEEEKNMMTLAMGISQKKLDKVIDIYKEKYKGKDLDLICFNSGNVAKQSSDIALDPESVDNMLKGVKMLPITVVLGNKQDTWGHIVVVALCGSESEDSRILFMYNVPK